ncbi:MAG: HEAT repeat domain-containing protein [Phycisphaerae bacterium]|nr:HEAT repeat domain-containing protein [Phycisphaerae bacterium]
MNCRPTTEGRRPARRAATAAVLLCIALAGEPACSDTPEAPAPQDALRALLGDPTTADATLAALAATGDRELLPVFAAAAKTGDRARRMLAVSAAAKLAGKGAADILYDRLRHDEADEVRSEALVQLISLEAVSNDQLTQLLQANDPTLRCLAARALVRAGQAGPALQTLKALAGSADPTLAGLARLTLLSTGEMEQLAPLAEVMRNPSAPPQLLSMLLGQITEDRIASAAELARELAVGTDAIPLKVRAYRAAATAGAGGRALLAQTIADSTGTVLRVQLLHLLADLPDPQEQLQSLARGDDAVGLLARLELARGAGGEPASQAARAAVALGHTVVIDYVLDRARGDLAERGKGADFYVPALVAIVQSARADSPVMLDEHTQAAQAAELLGELATDEATRALTAILSGPYNAQVRAVAAGLLRCKNKAACEWTAALLNSPYEELCTDAALTLGQHADHRAAAALSDILRQGRRHPPELTALAGWYLARITSRTAAAVSAATEALGQPASNR